MEKTEKTRKFAFKLTFLSRGESRTMQCEAVDRDRALQTFLRRRNQFAVSYSAIYQGRIENLGETEESIRKNSNNAEVLVNLLFKETESLKIQFIEKNAVWAKKKFKNHEKYSAYTTEDWCKYHGIEAVWQEYPSYSRSTEKGRWVYPESYYHNWDQRRSQARIVDQAASAVRKGVEKFVQEARDAADEHYRGSIFKLADRIMVKGLNMDKIKLSTSHMDVNIETIITDGEQTIRAWTIIASGPIKRPHYRYLTK